jgi:hypothetical protein
MHRRRFIAAAIAGLTVVPTVSAHAQTPSAAFEALDVALVRYRAEKDDSGLRTIVARTSVWADEETAGAFQEHSIALAGSDLPDGEFYQSEPEEWVDPDFPAEVPVMAVEWHTTIGYAAYRTEWGLFTVRRGTMVWEFWISGAEREPVREHGVLMMNAMLGYTAPDCSLDEADGFLPQSDAIPDGMDEVQDEVADDGLDYPVMPMISVPELQATPKARCGPPT